MNMRDHTVSKILPSVFKKICSDNCTCYIVAYHFYNNLDNVYIFKVESVHCLYVTIRSERCPQHYSINKTNISDARFGQQYCTLSISMMILLWNYYVADGISFVSLCHKCYAKTVLRKKRGE